MSTQTVELLSPDAMKWLQHLEVMQLIRLPKAASKQKTPKKTGISELYGTLNWGVTIEEVESQLKSLRDEWERDFS